MTNQLIGTVAFGILSVLVWAVYCFLSNRRTNYSVFHNWRESYVVQIRYILKEGQGIRVSRQSNIREAYYKSAVEYFLSLSLNFTLNSPFMKDYAENRKPHIHPKLLKRMGLSEDYVAVNLRWNTDPRYQFSLTWTELCDRANIAYLGLASRKFEIDFYENYPLNEDFLDWICSFPSQPLKLVK